LPISTALASRLPDTPSGQRAEATTDDHVVIGRRIPAVAYASLK
jgi:hypothetical protein